MSLYARMPYIGDLDDVRKLLVPGKSVLELGAGAGRLTRRLLEWGSCVTAVDDSMEMLAHVPPEAMTVHANIEDLALGCTFDTVLLASNLINHPEPGVRRKFAVTLRRHVNADGHALVERHDVQVLRSAYVGRSSSKDGPQTSVESVELNGLEIEMTVAYRMGDDVWWHSFRAAMLSEEDVEDLLCQCGFASFEWLGTRRKWLAAKLK